MIARKNGDGNGYLTRQQWYGLSRELRIQWLEETKLDRLPPSPALLNAALSHCQHEWEAFEDKFHQCKLCGALT